MNREQRIDKILADIQVWLDAARATDSLRNRHIALATIAEKADRAIALNAKRHELAMRAVKP